MEIQEANAEKSKRKTRTLLIALAVAGLLIFACCVGGAALIGQSPAVQSATRGVGAAMVDMLNLQKKVAAELLVPLDQVGVRINQQFSNSTSGKRNNETILLVILENTPLNKLPEADKEKRAQEVAGFAAREYAGIASVDTICVILSEKTEVLFFSSSQTRNYCYPVTKP